MESLEIANHIINYCINKSVPISNLQLQKLAYFVQLSGFRNLNERIIDDDFEAWEYGPVLRNAYNEFCIYGANLITIRQKSSEIESRIKKIIDSTMDENIFKKPWELVEKSHKKGGAWHKIYKGQKEIIPIYLIKEEALNG